MFEINQTKINEGRAAYHGGLDIRGLVERMHADYILADAAAKQRPDGTDGNYDAYRQAEINSKSFSIGFADGLLADFRRMAGKEAGRGGLRA